MTRNLYALLVGIDKYPNTGDRLNGCVNDIKAVEKFLKNRLNERYSPHIEKLIDEQATRQAVIDKFENHLCQAGRDDIVLFYFCGHGSQELAGPEFDALEYEKESGKKKLETIVCYDSRTVRGNGTEIRDLADKELRYLIAQVAKNEPHILVVYDCCHSSSGTRDTDRKERVRRLSTDTRQPRTHDEFCFPWDNATEQNLKQGIFPEGKHVFMSACLHTETAKEIDDEDGKEDGKGRGVFSYFLLKELNSLNATLSYNDLLNEVKGHVHGRKRDQTPQIEPIGMSSQDLNSIAFLGDREVIKPREPYFNLIYRHKIQDRQSAEWIVTGGVSQFLQEGSELAVYPQNCTLDEMKDKSRKLGNVRITAVRMEESAVTFISEPEPPTDSSYKAVLTKRPLPTVRFYLEGDAAALAQVEEKLADSLVVGLEDDRNKPHQYRLYAREQRFEITDADDRLLVVPIQANGEYDVNKAVKQVEHIARWTKTRQLENPNSSILKDAIEIEITHNGKVYTNSDLQIEHGSTIRLKLKNTRNQPLYCAILDVADNYEVSLLRFFPEGGDRTWICLYPGQTYQAQALSETGFIEEIPFGMPDEVINQGLTEYQEVLKLIVSTEAFTTLSQFEQNSLSLADQKSRQPLTAPPVTGWMTKQITLTTVQADSVELTPQTEKVVSAGVQVIAPPGLQATARLKPPSSTTRSVSSIGLPALLDNTEAFQFSTSRSVRQNASVLELEVNPSTLDAVKPDSPMVISVDRPLQPNERVLAVAHDGQFYFPLGVGQAENGKTEIKIERLCDPQRLNPDERELRQAIQLCFRKVVLDNVGQNSSYAWLRKATVNGDGTVSYTKKGDVDTVKAAVAKAKNIVLYIHGIIGDTESMIPSVRYAKVNANGQTKSLEELYDLVLAFDYESLNTSIEDTARELKRQLAAVGLEPNHGKTLHILAHSMGGLVSRSFIEQGNGNEVVSHLIMVGTPNAGSPWATVHDLATTLLSFGLNLSSVPIVPSLLEKLVEAMSVTLREMHATKSSFLDELKAFADPKCPYSIIAGSTALMDRASEVKQLLDALKQKMRRVIELPFGDEENDIAVAVTSIIDVPKDRSPAVYTPAPIACDHLSYFRQTEGLHAIASVVGRAFGYPPDPLPPTRPSAPQGPQPNPVSPSPSSDTGTQSMRSTKGIPTEPTSNPNSSGDGNGSVNANASASTSGAGDTNESVPLQPRHSETVIASEPQVISPPSPQTEPIPSQEASPTPTQPQPNHETRTTTWFTKSHIIAIGIDKYNSDIEPLDNAVSDAKKIAGIFETQGFEKHLLLGEKDKPHLVNRDEVRKLLTNLKNTVGENDRLIFYYAGHGIALPSQDSSEPEANSQSSTNGKPETKPRNKPQGYLILQEAEQNKPETYLPMDDLIQWLSAISCRHYLMILDCCYAGAIQWSFGRTRQVLLPKVFPSLLDTFIDSPAWQILTSSDEDQPANDGLLQDFSLQKNNRVSQDKTSSNSPFVCFLEQALVEGKAQIPESQIVTTTELSSYLRCMVESSTSQAGKRQTPRLFTLPEKHKRGEFVFLLDTFKKVKKHLEDNFPDPKIDDEHNPYRGLQSYTDKEEDSNVFFGRKRLIEKLSKYVHTHPLTVVLGTSGVGKSSLVNAGLVPKLKGNSEKTEQSQSLNSEEKTTQQPDSEPKAPPVKWENAIFRPGQSPAKALEEALKKLEAANIPDDTKRLLVIDQFEEIETQCRDEEQKKKFWNQLIAQLNNTSNKLHFVVTLRSDFESTLRSKFEYAINKFGTENDKSKIKGHSKVESTNLPKSTNEQFKFSIDWVAARFIVPAMKREELQDVIEKPAEEKAVFFTLEQKLKSGTERTLVQQLVNEVAGMPGALPLLSFALYTMYRNFAQRYVDAEKAGDLIKREITWEDYNSLGADGVLGSLTRRADEEYKNLEYKLDKVEENDKSLLKVVKDEQGKAIEEEASIKKARQEMLKWVMLRMVTLDDGQVARRRVLKKELKYDERYNRTKSEQLDLVIQLFDQARLLVQGNVEVFNEKVEGGQITEKVEEKEYVEPAHDALILNWEKLREWIKEDKGNIILRDRVIPDINDWQRLREAEKPSNWKQHLLNLPGTGVDQLVEQLRVKGELKRLNKQENAGQKQSVAASKNGHSSDENTKATAQETAEIASENLLSNQAITEEVSSHLSENGHSFESNAAVTAQETVETASENLLSNQAITEEARPQAHSEGTQHPKSSDRLWDKESRLDVLGQQLAKLRTSKESWLNKTEADFVLQSLIEREKGRAIRKFVFLVIGISLSAATAWALNEQRNTLIEQIRTSRQSAEANLQANRDLEALTDILRSKKNSESCLIWIPQLLSQLFTLSQPSDETMQIRAILLKVLHGAKERNRLQLDRGSIYRVVFHPKKDLLATVGKGESVRLWNSSGQQLELLSDSQNKSATQNQQNIFYSIALSSDNTLATGDRNGTVKLWKINDKGIIDYNSCKVLIPQTQKQAISCFDQSQPKSNDIGHSEISNTVTDIAFSPDSKLLAIIINNHINYQTEIKIERKVLIWKKDKNSKFKLEKVSEVSEKDLGTQKDVYDLEFFSPDKEKLRLVTLGEDNTVSLWSMTEPEAGQIGTNLDKMPTQQAGLTSIAFRYDNKLATSGKEGTVKLWEIKDDKFVREPVEIKYFCETEDSNVKIQKSKCQSSNQLRSIYDLAFSHHDTSKFATLGAEDTVTIWKNSDTQFKKIKPPEGTVEQVIAKSVAFSPDGKQLATIRGDDTIRLWDVSGNEINQFQIGGGNINSVAFSPDGKLLAISNDNGQVSLLNTSGKVVDTITRKIYGGSQPIKNVVFALDGNELKLITIPQEGNVRVFYIKNEKFEIQNKKLREDEKEIQHLKDMRAVAFSTDKKLIATVGTDGTLKVWKKLSSPSNQLKEILKIEGKFNSVTFSPNGKQLVTGENNDTVKFWDISQLKNKIQEPIFKFPTQQRSVQSVAFYPFNSNQIVTAGEDGTVKLWDLSPNKPASFITTQSNVETVAFSRDGKLLATIGKDDNNTHGLKLWNIKDNGIITPKNIYNSELSKETSFKSIVISPDSKLIVTVREKDSKVILWDLLGKQIDRSETHQGDIERLEFSPDGKILATVGKDKSLKLLEVKNNKLIQIDDFSGTALSKESSIKMMKFSPDGTQLATVDTNDTVKLWNMSYNFILDVACSLPALNKFQNFNCSTQRYSLLNVIPTQQKNVGSLAFSRDSKQLATGSSDRTVKLWDTQSKQFKQFITRQHQIYKIEFSSDGELIATIGDSEKDAKNLKNTVMLWDSQGNLLDEFSAQQGSVKSAVFNPNNKQLAIIDDQGNISLWKVGGVDELRQQACQLVQEYLEHNPNVNETDKQQLCPNTPKTNALFQAPHEKISRGDKILILVPGFTNPDKEAGVAAFATGDFATAEFLLQESLQQQPNNPEALIYLNNARAANQILSYTIAVPVPITSNSNGALEILRGVAQAQNEINSTGGINGVPLRVLIADDQGDEKAAQQLAQQLADNPDVLGVVGHFASGVTKVAGAIYNKNKLMAISPVSTAIDLGSREYVLRTVPNDHKAAEALATQLVKSNLKNAAVFYNSKSDYSNSLKSAFKSDFEAKGGHVQDEHGFDLSKPDFEAEQEVGKAKQQTDTLVLLADTTTLDQALKVAKANADPKLGVPLQLFAGDDVYTWKTLDSGKETVKGMVLAVPWHIDSDFVQPEFREQSDKLWGGATVNWRTAMAYDATQAFIQVLDKIQKDGKTPTREAIASELRSGQVTTCGASGRIKFDSSGDRDQKSQLVVVESSSNSRSKTGYDFKVLRTAEQDKVQDCSQNAPSPTPSSNNRQDAPSSSAPSKVQSRPQNAPSPTPASKNEQNSYRLPISDSRQANKLNSTSVDAYINRGLTYHRQGNYQQAINNLNRAIALNPNSAKAYSNRAVVHNGHKDYQQAIADSSQAISLNPTYANAYINRGLAYYHQDKYQQAIADYTKAIELDPGNALAYSNRALAYTRLGNQQAAQADKRKAAALSQRQSQ